LTRLGVLSRQIRKAIFIDCHRIVSMSREGGPAGSLFLTIYLEKVTFRKGLDRAGLSPVWLARVLGREVAMKVAAQRRGGPGYCPGLLILYLIRMDMDNVDAGYSPDRWFAI
jgi:hypothetical protein